jgi:integrase
MTAPIATTALVPYTGGDALTRMDVWASLPDDELKRRAVEACRDHDAPALWGLTEAYLLAHGRHGAKISPHTLRNYKQGIGSLLDAWTGVDLLKPHRKAPERWLRGLESVENAATVRIRLAAARALYKALRDAGATSGDPFKDVTVTPNTTAPEQQRGPYPPEAIEKLIATARGDDLALVLLGAHAGLRLAEILALRWDDVDDPAATLTVRAGKGNKTRVVHLSARLAQALRTLRETRPGVVGERGVYVIPYGSQRSARRRLDLLCGLAGVAYQGAHALRHSAGTKIYALTGKLEMVQRHLGHATITTSQIYAHWGDEKLTDAVRGL